MHFKYGGFWPRAMAFLLDKIIIYLLLFLVIIVGIMILGLSIFSITPTILITPLFLSYYGVNLLLNMLYFTYFHGTSGQTPGKKLLGLKVIQKTGEPMTPGIAFLRWVGYIVSGMVFYLGFIWIGFDSRKQGWHDKIAGTFVVRTRHRRDDEELFGPPRNSYPYSYTPPPSFPEPESDSGNEDRFGY